MICYPTIIKVLNYRTLRDRRVKLFSTIKTELRNINTRKYKQFYPIGIPLICIGVAILLYPRYSVIINPNNNNNNNNNISFADIPFLSDDVYNNTDNLLVIVFKDEDHRTKSKPICESFLKLLNTKTKTKNDLVYQGIPFTIFYGIRSGSVGGEDKDKDKDKEEVIEVVLYKGQRRQRLLIPSVFIYSYEKEKETHVITPGVKSVKSEIERKENGYSQVTKTEKTEKRQSIFQILNDIKQFFIQISADPDSISTFSVVQEVTLSNFREEVIGKVSEENNILIQMYEESCFLCFLMRPFVNELQEMLTRRKYPVTIKKMDIEKNDLPEESPVTRGTPTFVIYEGNNNYNKIEKFKPQDIVDWLVDFIERKSSIQKTDSFVSELESFRQEASALAEKLHRRFELISSIIIWNTEIAKLQIMDSIVKLMRSDQLAVSALDKEQMRDITGDDSDIFDIQAKELMKEDFLRSDNLTDNISFLTQQMSEIEADALCICSMSLEKMIAKDGTEGEVTCEEKKINII